MKKIFQLFLVISVTFGWCLYIQAQQWCEPFTNLNNWTVIGPAGLTNWTAASSNYAGGTAPELSMTWNPQFNGESKIRSGLIPLLNNKTFYYSFNFYLDWFADPSGVFTVSITYDGGTTALPIYSLTNPIGNVGPQIISGTFITPLVGSQNAQLEITFNGNSYNIDNIYCDNICITWLPGPGYATNPNPINGATGVSVPNVTLSWTNPTGATTNSVYFGTDQSNLSLIHSGSLISSIPVTGLNNSTQYYWRVDETDGSGTTTGFLWNFSTPFLLTDGLVAFYPFNGNTLDESGNDWDGIGTNITPIMDRFGFNNKAYYFNGSNSTINFGLVPIPITNFSVSVWINSNETGRGVVLMNAWTNRGFALEFVFQDGTLSFEVNQSSPTFNRISVPIVNNSWHHVVATCNNDLIKLYVDEELKVSQSGPIGTQSNEILSAGFDHKATDYYYSGSMDDIRIYNRVINDDEIQALYHENNWPGNQGPIAYYPLNGDMNDHSGNNNNGTTNGGVSWGTDRFDITGKAAQFNGIDGFVEVPNSSSLQSPTTSISLSAWIYIEDWYNGGYAPILTKSDNSSSNYQYHFYINNQNFVIGLASFGYYSIPYSFDLNIWYHIAVSWDGNLLKIFINNYLIQTISDNGAININTLPLNIGRDTPGQTEYLNGKLDDIRIYNRALSEAEILELYNEVPSPHIALLQTDFRKVMGENVLIEGTLKDGQVQPISNTYIAVYDGMKQYNGLIQTNENGSFSYTSDALRVGNYQIFFEYYQNNQRLAKNNALITVGNNSIISIFRDIKYYNDTNQPIEIELIYEGKTSINSADIKHTQTFQVPPATTVVLVEGSVTGFKPDLIDNNSGQGSPPPGSTSIGNTLCPVQVGGVTICGPDPNDPNSQVFTGSYTFGLGNHLGITLGLYYDKRGDFGLTVGGSVGQPYVWTGSAGLALGTDGFFLQSGQIIGISKVTARVKLLEAGNGNNITGVIHSPVDPFIVDTEGRKFGIDPVTNQFVNEIPMASFTGCGTEPLILDIPNPQNGNWDFTLIGREAGPYTMEKIRYYNNIVDQQIFNGISYEDSLTTYQVVIDTTQTTLLPPDSLNIIVQNTSILINWSKVLGAESYSVYYDTDTSGIPYYGIGATQGNSPISGIVDTSLILSGLTDNQIYYFVVTAVDSNGTQSYFSTERSILFNPGITNTFQLTVNVNNGWNMVSVPGLNTPDQNVNTWWQYRDPVANVFRYVGGYQTVTTAVPGTGYWMKHAGARTYNTGDEWPAGGINVVAHAPITAESGWNLFGGYELSVTAANVTTNPPGLLSGPIYSYSGGYQVATVLDPGYGYWIKLSAAGQIIIPETLSKGEALEWFPEEWGRIVITDNAGHSYKLYAVSDKSKVDLSAYELPPAPPEGMFDIRYESGRIAEDINSSINTIDMSGVTYPLTVRVEGMDIRLMDESGKMINTNLKSGEDVVISDATIQKLMVSGELLPTVYSLEQNYPNPFNPSTVIEFSLPEDVANVKLSIYNALGEKVAELVNTSLTAGKYQYQWNAKNVATGMYIYELRTDKFVSIKKMILIK